MAINFWSANDFNYYILEDITQSNVSITGRLSAGKNANLNNVTIGSAFPIDAFGVTVYIGENLNIIGGTTTQNTGADTTATITNYTMANLNSVAPQPKRYDLKMTNEYSTKYLRCISVDWALLPTNGTVSIDPTTKVLTLTGLNSQFNNFLIDSNHITGSNITLSEVTGINIQTPSGSTVMVSFTGNNLTINPMTTLFNGLPISLAQAANILFNFPEATTIQIKSDIYAALLAPFADIVSEAYTIYGTLMSKNISGSLNGVNNIFTGSLPELYNPSTTKSCSSFTTSTSTTTSTTTTTTTTSTASLSTTTCDTRCQAKIDIIESIALEQTALSHILNAEGEKIQKILSLLDVTPEELLEMNLSVNSLVNSITLLEVILHGKASLVHLCDC